MTQHWADSRTATLTHSHRVSFALSLLLLCCCCCLTLVETEIRTVVCRTFWRILTCIWRRHVQVYDNRRGHAHL